MSRPGAGTPAPGSHDDGDQAARSVAWGLWIAVGSLTSAAFAAGLLAGVVIDGNAEIMREFRDRTPTRMVSSGSPAPSSPSPTPASSSQSAATDRRQNNQVDWAITIAPGTNVAAIDVRTADLDADSKVEFGMVYGSQVSPVATLWVQAASSARIVLPIGRYAVRTTRLPVLRKDGDPEPEAVTVDGALEVARERADVVGASLAGNRTGTWRISTAATKAARKPKARSGRARRSRDFEYEGLGDGSRTGGTSTYDG